MSDEIGNPVTDDGSAFPTDKDGEDDAGASDEVADTGIFLGGTLDLPMTMHQAAVKFCMAEDVDGGTKVGFVLRVVLLTFLEFALCSSMSWDNGCVSNDQCKQGVSACWDMSGTGYKQCHYCHDFYDDRTCKAGSADDDDEPGDCTDADTEVFWDHIVWRSKRKGHAPPWASADEVIFDHKYAGQALPRHVGNASFSCFPDDELCGQCFNTASGKFGRWGDTDVATDNMRAMRFNDWLVLLAFAMFHGTMAATFICDIAIQVMLMVRAMKAEVPGIMPFVIFFNFLAGARHMILGNMFGIFNVFARVHHDSGHAKEQVTFLLQGFVILNFSRIMYAYAAPPHLRKILADKEPEYEATQSEVNTMFYTRILYILFITEATWVSLFAVRDDMNPVPPMHLMLSFLVFIGYGALYPAANTGEMLKNVGLQFGRFVCGFITFIIVDATLFN